MTFKMPETSLDFSAMPPADRVIAIAHLLEESADKCRNNVLTSGTWIEETFRQAAYALFSAGGALLSTDIDNQIMQALIEDGAIRS